MPFFVEKGDLVSMNVDALVNASNVNLSMVEGVGRAIYHKAGDAELAKACKAIGHCDVGDAVMTAPFGITNTKAIIHAVAPIYINGKHDEEENLRKVYSKCLQIAVDNNFKSIAFPLLSGEFNYPLKECYGIALDVIKNFLKTHLDMNVYLVMYKNFPEMISDETQIALTKYIIDCKASNFSNDNTVGDFDDLIKKAFKKTGLSMDDLAYQSNIRKSYLETVLNKKKSELINKDTIISLGVGFGLTKEELNHLLISRGFVIEPSIVANLIVCYFLDHNDYDIYKINSTLFQYGFKPLGCDL